MVAQNVKKIQNQHPFCTFGWKYVLKISFFRQIRKKNKIIFVTLQPIYSRTAYQKRYFINNIFV